MAKFHSSTFGAISGKHGTAVAVTRKDGISYIRMHVIPHNPRTDKQQAHRSKIGLVSKSLAPFNPIFKHTMGVTNGISIARSHAFKNAIVDEYPNFSIDYEKLMFSFGSLESVHNSSTSFLDGVVSINWDFKKMYNCHANDSVSLVVFNKDANQALHIEDIALRREKQAKIDIHEAWSDSELYFWAYVRSGDKISDSVFVGKYSSLDIKPDIPNKVETQDRDTYVAESELEVKVNEPQSNCFNASEVIINFIMLMCNVFRLFRIKVTVSNIKNYVEVLRFKASGLMMFKGYSDSECECNCSLWDTEGGVFEEMCVKYQHIFNTLLMSRNTILNV